MDSSIKTIHHQLAGSEGFLSDYTDYTPITQGARGPCRLCAGHFLMVIVSQNLWERRQLMI
jgi:hypothetical protein